MDLGEGPRESEVVVMKERRLVPIEPVYEGMARFSFLLETCAPGSVPDPPLIAAILDLVIQNRKVLFLNIYLFFKYFYKFTARCPISITSCPLVGVRPFCTFV
jgi:hypothetical protein